MRNPSLHILLSDLEKVLAKTGDKTPKETAMLILRLSVPYHIKNRYLVRGNAGARKKAEKLIIASSKSDYTVEQFNGLMASLRQQRGEKRVRNIVKGSSEWLMLKEITGLAREFVEMYEFEPVEEGYKTFIQVGMELMGKKFSINKYKFYAPKIHEFHEAKVVLSEDTDPENSKIFWEIWMEIMQSHAGTTLDILVPEKFINIIYARQEADEADAEYEDWIEAQFEELAFLNAIPELVQLHGPNAKERYSRYMVKKNKPDSTKKVKTRQEQANEEKMNLPKSLSQEQTDYFSMMK